MAYLNKLSYFTVTAVVWWIPQSFGATNINICLSFLSAGMAWKVSEEDFIRIPQYNFQILKFCVQATGLQVTQ